MAGNLSNKNDSENTGSPRSTDPEGSKEKKQKTGFRFSELRQHKNPVIRIFMKAIYSIWLAVMGIGVFFAWIISVLLL